MVPTDSLFTLWSDWTAPRETFVLVLIDISNVWQPKSNYLKRAKSGRKRVLKEVIAGLLSLPPFYHFPAPRPFSRTYHFRVFPTIWEPGTGYVLAKNAVLVGVIRLLGKKKNNKTFQLPTHCNKTEIDFITQEPSLLSRRLEVICRPVQRRCFFSFFDLFEDIS